MRRSISGKHRNPSSSRWRGHICSAGALGTIEKGQETLTAPNFQTASVLLLPDRSPPRG